MIRSTLRMTKQTPFAARGMVVAEHPIGAEVGAGILARGGNAVDAAVATAFAMPVVEPFMSTLAGGGSFLIHMARRGETVAIDANVEAPARAHEHCYELGEGVSDDLFPWRRVVGDANVFGPRAVAIPGSVAGLCLALQRYGTMTLADVLAPAIRLAEEGFIPDWYVAQTISLYTRELRAFPETARTYLRDGLDIYRPPASQDGDVLRQPDLGRSLRLIAKEGPDAFYRGAIAQAIHEEVQGEGRLSDPGGPGRLRGAGALSADGRLSRPRAGVHARSDRRHHRARDLEPPRGVPAGASDLSHARRAPRARRGGAAGVSRPPALSRRRAPRHRSLGRARLAHLRARPRPPDQARRPPHHRLRARPLEIRRSGHVREERKRDVRERGRAGATGSVRGGGRAGAMGVSAAGGERGPFRAPADGELQRLHDPHRRASTGNAT